jgi:hypothetical protein
VVNQDLAASTTIKMQLEHEKHELLCDLLLEYVKWAKGHMQGQCYSGAISLHDVIADLNDRAAKIAIGDHPAAKRGPKVNYVRTGGNG